MGSGSLTPSLEKHSMNMAPIPGDKFGPIEKECWFEIRFSAASRQGGVGAAKMWILMLFEASL
jgi:hypothetical protein